MFLSALQARLVPHQLRSRLCRLAMNVMFPCSAFHYMLVVVRRFGPTLERELQPIRCTALVCNPHKVYLLLSKPPDHTGHVLMLRILRRTVRAS